MLSLTTYLAIVVGLLALAPLLLIGRRPKSLPPGPPTLPIIGNLHLMPSKDAHLQFQAWAREYGPIYSLILGTKAMIVLSSPEVVKELLDRRSAIYSDRIDAYVGSTLACKDMKILTMRYGPRWKTARKLFHGILHINVAKTYVPYQSLESKQMLHEILESPADFFDSLKRYSGSLTAQMTYGWRTPVRHDPKMKLMYQGLDEYLRLNHAGFAAMADFFPILRILPALLMPTKAAAIRLFEEQKGLFLGHWYDVKKAIQEGTSKPCQAADLARLQEKEKFSDEEAAFLIGNGLEAGADTTASAMYTFVQAMVLYPEVQQMAQAQIASPHAMTQDDRYQGYLIPKGTGVLNNVWTICSDPARYPSPRRFEPDRYKNDILAFAETATHPNPNTRDLFTFGAGRRICQGMHVAERSMFIGMSRLLWAFDLKVIPGKEPDPAKISQGLACMPAPYTCDIRPREGRANVIRAVWDEAQSLLDEQGQWRDLLGKMSR